MHFSTKCFRPTHPSVSFFYLHGTCTRIKTFEIEHSTQCFSPKCLLVPFAFSYQVYIFFTTHSLHMYFGLHAQKGPIHVTKMITCVAFYYHDHTICDVEVVVVCHRGEVSHQHCICVCPVQCAPNLAFRQAQLNRVAQICLHRKKNNHIYGENEIQI